MFLPRWRSVLTALSFCFAIGGSARAADADLDGKQIYANKCAQCHGSAGEGSKDIASPLEGDLSISELAKVIQETMPEDDPGSLSPEESQAVAAHVHDAFYSAIARARNKPARIELARLTVRQYRHAVADLIGSFAPPVKQTSDRGLEGEYFNGRRPQGRRERVARRIDPQIDFDFGTEAPLDGIEDPTRYSIRWNGSVYAPETGDYEFVVRTEHAARLWINESGEPLIDAWVKSGDDTEFTASKYLVGGRVYNLRLEFSKAKQGVDDSDKQKEKPPSAPASLSLQWQRPRGGVEPIPTRFLRPENAPEAYICDVPFPPDDRSYGWERGTAVSKAWDEATTQAAIAAAGYIEERLNKLAYTNDEAPDREAKLRRFCTNFAERAFRCPSDSDSLKPYVDRQFAESPDPDAAVKRIVLLVLKSPRFLFREVADGHEAHDVAARLSFGLWDSIPDRELFNAAQYNRLNNAEHVRKQAERMLADLRAETKLRNFLLTWLHIDATADLSKDRERFPDFDEATSNDLWTSLELFLDDVLESEDADFRQLLLSNEVYLNERLADFYNANSRPENGYQRIALDDGHRAGVLTHPYLMARFAYNRESSPIHRGVFLARGVMGTALHPPPEAFTPLSPELHPDLTTRERVTLQTKADSCMVCHRIINPLGFALERFDAVGRYREAERSKIVDDTAAYPVSTGEPVTLKGARSLAEFLAGNEDCHAAFVEQMFQFLVQQSAAAYGPEIIEELRQTFAEKDFNIRHLAVEIMVASALQGRETKGAENKTAQK